MKTVSDLLKDVQIPKMLTVKQHFDRNGIPKEDLQPTLLDRLNRYEISSKIIPGSTIAITCGSRGITNIALFTKTIVDFVKGKNATPIIIGAMGSHGGATEEGQLQVLKDYGITEEKMGCQVLCSMETVEISRTKDGLPVAVDKNAARADGIIVMNRIKPHTSFRGPYESGLMKMMAIGLGKQIGAEIIHGEDPGIMGELILEFGKAIMEALPIVAGIGIIENAYDETMTIAGLTPEEILSEEPILLKESYKTIPRLLFDSCDVLVVDQIGKNISGDGMDPNVSGRFCTPYASGGIKADKVVVLDLTDETHGNAHGCGMADCTTRRLYDKMKFEMTYPTAITNRFLHLMKIPMVMDNDREALQLAIGACPCRDPLKAKVIRIKNTAHLEDIEISEALLEEALKNPRISIVSDAADLQFNSDGNLFT